MIDASKVQSSYFFEVERILLPAGLGDIGASFLTCDIEKFDSAAFEREAMACPESIRRSVKKRQAEFFFGRMAARDAMIAAAFPPSEIGIGESREPLWPKHLVGSISHTGPFAVAAVAARQRFSGVGVDIEYIASPSSLIDLRANVLDSAEREMLSGLPSGLQGGLPETLVFSAKETLFKAAFPSVRRFFDFAAAEVKNIQFDTRTLTLVVTESLNDHFRPGRECHISFRLIRANVVMTSLAW